MKIYLVYFQEAYRVQTPILEPIQVGRAFATDELDMIGDDTGDNISELNPYFNELTAQYWAWKNSPDEDVVGFFHYRRLLDFRPEMERTVDRDGLVRAPLIDDDFFEEYGLDEPNIRRLTDQYDIILPDAFDVRDIGQPDVQTQYRTAASHNERDYLEAGRIIKSFYPDDHRYFKQTSKSPYLYPTNIFIMRKDFFDEYCRWLFPILFKLHENIDTSTYSASARRAVGYIAERLLTVYVNKLKAERPELRILHLRRVLVMDTSRRNAQLHLPAPKADDTITIVASTDSTYVPQMAALVASVLRQLDLDRPVEFIILDGGISTQDQQAIKELNYLHKKTVFHFIDMSLHYRDVVMGSYFPTSTLYRLALPDLLPKHDKVLFLDTDMVVARNVAELFDRDLDDHLIAAAPDLIMRSFCALGATSDMESGAIKATKYLSDHLRLNPVDQIYFQAGVLLMNLREMRNLRLSQKMLADIRLNRYWFFDQDILNKHCRGRVLYLENEWNTVYMDERHSQALSVIDQKVFHKTLENPAIVHFAGITKPWNSNFHPLGYLFWRYLRDTRFYEELLIAAVSQKKSISTMLSPSPGVIGGSLYNLASTAWHVLPESVRYSRLHYFGVRMKRLVQR